MVYIVLSFNELTNGQAVVQYSSLYAPSNVVDWWPA